VAVWSRFTNEHGADPQSSLCPVDLPDDPLDE